MTDAPPSPGPVWKLEESRRWVVRTAQRDDVPALLALETSFPGDRISRASFLRLLASRHTDVWVACSEADTSTILGDAIVTHPPGGATAHLDSIVVHEASRGRGVARALLDAAENAARERAFVAMRLDVRVDNEVALRLYEHAGYAYAGIVPHYYEDGTDALRMRKRLASPVP